MNNFNDKVGFIWSVADLLRGDYKQSEYGKVILPLTVLRRLDCVLKPTKQRVLDKAKAIPATADETMRDVMLCSAAGQTFYNTSKFTFASLLHDQEHLAANLNNFVNGFSPGSRDIFVEKFKLGDQVQRLDEANLLFLVLSKFTEIDLHPEAVDNVQMGYIFEELIRRFSEASNETAGEHFTPREVIRLMVNLLFTEDSDALTKAGVIRTLYDPAAGTGGMLSVTENYLRELNRSATLKVFGQEINPESFAVCKSDMLIKGEDASNIKFGNSFTQDGLSAERFDYFLSNPPFGVEWKKVEKEIRAEAEELGTAGRFGAGLPRVSDGSLLFLQHMVSKFKQDGTGSRLAIVFNGLPLFTGSAGSGESEIRRWLIENDWLEAVIGLPDQLFYNTGISTYVWVVTNRKPPHRRGKVQLVNAVDLSAKMRKSLGNKRNEITAQQIDEITRVFGDFVDGDTRQVVIDGTLKTVVVSKVFDNDAFGYRRITVERPLRLSFAVTPERLERVKASKVFTDILKAKAKKSGTAAGDATFHVDDAQQALLAALDDVAHLGVVKNRERFTEALKKAFKAKAVPLSPPLLKGLLSALGEQDETADVCTDARGNPEPDADLRDNDNVPLTEEVHDYFRREVLPHLPDAWIDEGKTKVGYEVPFTRHFYQYTPLRPLKEIEAEIATLEEEIQGLLKGVLA